MIARRHQGVEPFQAADFKSRDAAKAFVRSVLSDQDARGVSRLFAPALAMRSADDRVVATNAKLLGVLNPSGTKEDAPFARLT